MQIEPGRVLSERYRLVRPLGQGSQATVWSADHLALSTHVAVKLIDPDLAKKEAARERFKREATAAAQLRSAHVVHILDHGIDNGQPFIVMELLEGEDLFTRLERVGRLSLAETSKVVTHVARALVRAHGANIVHRDLKPENVFIVTTEEDEIVKVLDFGVAKVSEPGKSTMQRTGIGTLIGTPHYMSPEQVKGLSEVDHRTDLWALGVIAFQCMTGQLPFDSEGVGDLLIKISMGDMPVPSHFVPEIPAAFDAWFVRACARDVTKRFQDAREMAVALAAVVAGESAAAATAAAGRDAMLSASRDGASPQTPTIAAAPLPVAHDRPSEDPPTPPGFALPTVTVAAARTVIPATVPSGGARDIEALGAVLLREQGHGPSVAAPPPGRAAFEVDFDESGTSPPIGGFAVAVPAVPAAASSRSGVAAPPPALGSERGFERTSRGSAPSYPPRASDPDQEITDPRFSHDGFPLLVRPAVALAAAPSQPIAPVHSGAYAPRAPLAQAPVPPPSSSSSSAKAASAFDVAAYAPYPPSSGSGTPSSRQAMAPPATSMPPVVAVPPAPPPPADLLRASAKAPSSFRRNTVSGLASSGRTDPPPGFDPAARRRRVVLIAVAGVAVLGVAIAWGVVQSQAPTAASDGGEQIARSAAPTTRVAPVSPSSAASARPSATPPATSAPTPTAAPTPSAIDPGKSVRPIHPVPSGSWQPASATGSNGGNKAPSAGSSSGGNGVKRFTPPRRDDNVIVIPTPEE